MSREEMDKILDEVFKKIFGGGLVMFLVGWIYKILYGEELTYDPPKRRRKK